MQYVSVDAIRRYKPDPKTYEYFVQTQQMQIGELDPSEVVLVSANPFDVVGAAGAGMGSVWVDREGRGWGDGLGRPGHVVRSLEEVVGVVERGESGRRRSEEESDPTVGRG